MNEYGQVPIDEITEINGYYNAACKYCGQIKSVRATSEEKAEEIVSAECNCDEAKEAKRVEKLFEIVDMIMRSEEFSTPDLPVIDITKKLVELVVEEQIDSVTISFDDAPVKITMKANGTVKVERVSKKKMTMEA